MFGAINVEFLLFGIDGTQNVEMPFLIDWIMKPTVNLFSHAAKFIPKDRIYSGRHITAVTGSRGNRSSIIKFAFDISSQPCALVSSSWMTEYPFVLEIYQINRDTFCWWVRRYSCLIRRRCIYIDVTQQYRRVKLWKVNKEPILS